MKLVVSQKSDKPIYEQIYEQIAVGILSGAILPLTMLPSIRGIAAELGISVITVKSAYELLERDGYIYTEAGRGCFVSRIEPSLLEHKRDAAAIKKFREAVDYARSIGLNDEEIKNTVAELLK